MEDDFVWDFWNGVKRRYRVVETDEKVLVVEFEEGRDTMGNIIWKTLRSEGVEYRVMMALAAKHLGKAPHQHRPNTPRPNCGGPP